MANDLTLTWIGSLDGTASFPTANRALIAALRRAGVTVQVNKHNLGDSADLTPLAVAFEYPPVVLNVRHPVNVCLSVWEFGGGARAVPGTFKQAFADFDAVWVPNEFVRATYAEATPTPVRAVRFLGVDPQEFRPGVVPADWGDLFPGETWWRDARIVLGVGGTDLRHGWDIAFNALALLPPDVHLIAKWDTHYPRIDYRVDHPRFHILHRDLPSLAPLYRAADAVVISARGVGFSLPALEALACGAAVAATDLPPLREFATDRMIFAEGGHWRAAGIHHIHADCLPDWWETPPDALAAALSAALALPREGIQYVAWRDRWSWDGVAVDLIAALQDELTGVMA
jgi:glycosyltransferase involved in cell wall biosynthesis